MRIQLLLASLRGCVDRFAARLRALSVEQLLLVASLVVAFQGGLWTALFSLAGDRSIRLHGRGRDAGVDILIVGLVSAALLIAASRRRYDRYWPPPTRSIADKPLTKVLLCTFIGWFVLLAYPAWLALSRNPYEGVTWIGWSMRDFRWFIAFYLVTITSVVVLPPMFARLLVDHATTPPVPAPRAERRAARAATAIALGTALSLTLFAPPWNLERDNGEVGNHDVHLSQLQAIHKGSTPYIGPASIQYGPGSQMLQYWYMTLSGKFSLVGYRESYALATLLAFAIFSSISFGAFGIVQGALASLLALYISPFFLFFWTGPVFRGFWGWANPFRYLGAFVVVALLPSLLTATRGRRYLAFALGIAWGFFSWMSQESLAMTGLSAGFFLAAALSLRCYSFAQVGGVIAGLVAGFTTFWLPVLASYFAKGELLRFLEGYTLVSRFVAAGMSNTPWDFEYNRRWNAAFILTPYFLMAAAWLTMFDWSKRRFVAPLPFQRQQLLAFVCLSLVCFTGALFRRDSSHFINVLIGLPVVIAMTTSQLPRLAGRLLPRLLILAALVAFVAMFPGGPAIADFPGAYVTRPWERFAGEQPSRHSAWESERGIAFQRAGGFVSSDYKIFARAMPAREFFEAMDDAHAIVGDRPAFVHSFPQVPPEIVYFFADLRPGPLLFSLSTIVLNTDVLARHLRHMEAHCNAFEAVIGTDPTAKEVSIFKQCHPFLDEIPKTIAGSRYYIWMSSGAALPPAKELQGGSKADDQPDRERPRLARQLGETGAL
jgi:hypothetical protein